MQVQGEKPSPAQNLARTGANPPFTVVNKMFICGIDSPTIFQGDSQAERVSEKFFDDAFM